MYQVMRIRNSSHEESRFYYDDLFYGKGRLTEANTPESRRGHRRVLARLGVNGPCSERRILDVACGSGAFLEVASEWLKCSGLDISERAIEIATKRVPGGDLRVGAAERLLYESQSFDYVTCLGSLEHFIDMEAALGEMHRVLKIGGRAYILVPNLFSFHNVMNAWFFGRSPQADQVVERYAGEDEWTNMFKATGLKVLRKFGGSGSAPFSAYLGKYGLPGLGIALGLTIVNPVLPNHMHRNLEFVLERSERR